MKYKAENNSHSLETVELEISEEKLGTNRISKNGLQNDTFLKTNAEFYCYVNLLSDKHSTLRIFVITLVLKN